MTTLNGPQSQQRLKSVVEELKDNRKRKFSGQGDASSVTEKKSCNSVPETSPPQDVTARPRIGYSGQLKFIAAAQHGSGDMDRGVSPQNSNDSGNSSLQDLSDFLLVAASNPALNRIAPTSPPHPAAALSSTTSNSFNEFCHLKKLAGVVDNLPKFDLSNNKASENSSCPVIGYQVKLDEVLPENTSSSPVNAIKSSASLFGEICDLKNGSPFLPSNIGTTGDFDKSSSKGHTPLTERGLRAPTKRRVFRHSPRSGNNTKVDKIIKTELDTREGCEEPVVAPVCSEFVTNGSMDFRGVHISFMFDLADQQKYFLLNSIKDKVFPDWNKLMTSHGIQSMFRKLKMQPRLSKMVDLSWQYIVSEEELRAICDLHDSVSNKTTVNMVDEPTTVTCGRSCGPSCGVMEWHGAEIPYILRNGERYFIRNLLRSLLSSYQCFTAAHFGVMCNGLCQSVPCVSQEVDALSKLVPDGFTVTKSTRLVSLGNAEKIYQHVVRRHNYFTQKGEVKVEPSDHPADGQRTKTSRSRSSSANSVDSSTSKRSGNKRQIKERNTSSDFIYGDIYPSPMKSQKLLTSACSVESLHGGDHHRSAPLAEMRMKDLKSEPGQVLLQSDSTQGNSLRQKVPTHWKKACKQRATGTLSSKEGSRQDSPLLPCKQHGGKVLCSKKSVEDSQTLRKIKGGYDELKEIVSNPSHRSTESGDVIHRDANHVTGDGSDHANHVAEDVSDHAATQPNIPQTARHSMYCEPDTSHHQPLDLRIPRYATAQTPTSPTCSMIGEHKVQVVRGGGPNHSVRMPFPWPAHSSASSGGILRFPPVRNVRLPVPPAHMNFSHHSMHYPRESSARAMPSANPRRVISGHVRSTIKDYLKSGKDERCMTTASCSKVPMSYPVPVIGGSKPAAVSQQPLLNRHTAPMRTPGLISASQSCPDVPRSSTNRSSSSDSELFASDRKKSHRKEGGLAGSSKYMMTEGEGDGVFILKEAYRLLQQQYQAQCERNLVLCSQLVELEHDTRVKQAQWKDAVEPSPKKSPPGTANIPCLTNRQSFEVIKNFREQITHLTLQIKDRDKKISSLEAAVSKQQKKEMDSSRPS